MREFAAVQRQLDHLQTFDRSRRRISDLEAITSIAAIQVRDGLSHLLRTLDRVGLVKQRGYRLCVEALALKICDEQRNQQTPSKTLAFYVTEEEAGFRTLTDRPIQDFITRMQRLQQEAETRYPQILSGHIIDWQRPDHVRAALAVCQAFQ